MKRSFLPAWLCCVFLLASASCQAQSSAAETKAIHNLLDEQVTAWNRGDLDGFMAGYWHSPELTFFGYDGPHHGWQTLKDRYQKHYREGGHEMGTLTFSNLVIQIMAKDSAAITGRCDVRFKDGKASSCLFTLLARKFPAGWRIIHDHSSPLESAPPSDPSAASAAPTKKP